MSGVIVALHVYDPDSGMREIRLRSPIAAAAAAAAAAATVAVTIAHRWAWHEMTPLPSLWHAIDGRLGDGAEGYPDGDPPPGERQQPRRPALRFVPAANPRTRYFARG